jgi:hypothetical protein
MDDGAAYFARDRSRWLGSLFVLFIGICQLVYAFILTAFVGIAGGGVPPISSDIEIDFSTRSTAPSHRLPSCFDWPDLVRHLSFLWRRRWAWYYTWILEISWLAIGLYAYMTSEGALEAFFGTGLQTTGLVVAVLAGNALALLPLPRRGDGFFVNERLRSASVQCRR